MCEQQNKCHTLTFQVSYNAQQAKVYSVKDCEKMGLINIHADEVYYTWYQKP